MDSPTVTDPIQDLQAKTAELMVRCAELFARAGRGDLTDSPTAPVLGHAKRPEDRPVVAVVGETSRGKSALVNALIGRRGLSPVDPQVTTCVPVLFTYAQHEWAKVWIHPGDEGAQQEPTPIGVDEIGEYAHQTKNPGNSKLVQRVDVGIMSPVLGDLELTIADTPGVGGLNSGHADLTLAQLAKSDAVILVLDANVEISPSEIKFLRAAVAQVDTVIIAVTKTDLQFELGRVVEVNRDRIRREVPELGEPLLTAVSSRLVELAEELPPSEREEVRAGSGINDLIDALTVKVKRRRARLDLAYHVGECLQRLAVLDTHIVAAAAAADELELQKTLAAKRNRLTELQQLRIGWHKDMLVRLAQVEGAVIGYSDSDHDTLHAELARLSEFYRGLALNATSQDDFDKLVIALQADAVRATNRASEAIKTAMGHAIGTVVAFGIALDAETIGSPEEIDVPTDSHKPRPVRQEKSWIAHYNNIISPAVGAQGVILGAAGAAVGLAPLTGPWAFLLLPPLAALAIQAHHVAARRENYLGWLESYLQTVAGVARKTCQANIAAVSGLDVQDRVDALIDTEIAAAEAIVSKLTAALTSDAKARAEEAQRAQSIVAELADRRADAHELLVLLSADPETVG